MVPNHQPDGICNRLGSAVEVCSLGEKDPVTPSLWKKPPVDSTWRWNLQCIGDFCIKIHALWNFLSCHVWLYHQRSDGAFATCRSTKTRRLLGPFPEAYQKWSANHGGVMDLPISYMTWHYMIGHYIILYYINYSRVDYMTQHNVKHTDTTWHKLTLRQVTLPYLTLHIYIIT